MKIIKNLMYAFLGMFIGEGIACTILILVKQPTYMQFWRYAGYIYFPVYDFLFFLFPFIAYLVITRLFKVQKVMNKWGFSILGLFFALSDTLINSFLMVPFRHNLAKQIEGQTMECLVYYIMPFILQPLVSFWLAYGVYRIFKKQFYKQEG